MSEQEHEKEHSDGHGGKRSHGPPASGGGHEEAGESAPLWVISFADLSTLLMSFFVLMMASTPKGQTSSAPDAELLKVLASVKAAFKYRPDINSKDPLDQAVLRMLSSQSNPGTPDSGKWWKGPGIRGSSPEVRELWQKAQAAIGEPIPFAWKSTHVPAEWRCLIEAVAEVVREHYRVIIIRGHCAAEEAAGEKDGGFDLAYRRALALKDILAELGISPSRIRVVSCGPHEPALRNGPAADPAVLDPRAEITLGVQFLPEPAADTLETGEDELPPD